MIEAVYNLLGSFPDNTVKVLKGGLAARLGSVAICWYDSTQRIAVVNFPLYKVKCDNAYLHVGTQLSKLVRVLEGVLGDRDDALAAAYIPYFIYRGCDMLVAREDGLSLIINADDEEEAAEWFRQIETAYSFDPEWNNTRVCYQTPRVEDEALREEVHRLNAKAAAAVL